MNEALIVVDVLNDFRHEDSDALLSSFRARLPGLHRAIAAARESSTPVVFVNDHFGRWDGDGPGLVRRALAGRGPDVIRAIAPAPGDRLLLKARYSAFDHTGLDLLLGELETERLLLAGGATEMCVLQTGIDGRECGYQVTILADACATVDSELEEIALRYAEEVAGIVVARHDG